MAFQLVPRSSRKILFLAANPKNTSALRLGEELRNIQEGLQLASDRSRFNLISQWAVQLKDLQRGLLNHKPHIVHFSGHGAGDTGLLLEDAQGNAEPICSDSLASLFKLCPTDCVLLNACYSEKQAMAIAQFVPYVIGMDQAVDDKTAITFAVGFYDALGYGQSYQKAYEFGMAAIGSQPSIILRDIGTPSDSKQLSMSKPVHPILLATKGKPWRPTLSRVMSWKLIAGTVSILALLTGISLANLQRPEPELTREEYNELQQKYNDGDRLLFRDVRNIIDNPGELVCEIPLANSPLNSQIRRWDNGTNAGMGLKFKEVQFKQGVAKLLVQIPEWGDKTWQESCSEQPQ